MVFASNGLNIWAISYIPTNLSALLNGTAAFWIAGLGVFGKRGHPLTRWAVLGMIIGFAGTALMLIPKGGLRTSSLLAEIGALVACCAWALGTLYYRSIDTRSELAHVHGAADVHGGTHAARRRHSLTAMRRAGRSTARG